MKKSILSLFIFSFGLFVFAAPNVGAQGFGDRNRAGGDGSYEVTGRILLPSGEPAAGLRLSLSGADFTNGSSATDQDGEFRFSNVPAGNYYLNIKGVTGQFESENESIIIDRIAPSGQTFNRVIYLRAPGVKKGDRPTNPMLANVPKEAVKKYNSAAERAKKKDLNAAVAQLDEAIALHPEFTLAYNEKGLLLLEQNENGKALEAFVKAIQLKPDYLEAKLNFGIALFANNDYEKAGMVFQDVIREKDTLVTAHFYLGRTMIKLNKVDEAEAELKKTLSMKGGENLAMAHRFLGGIYMQKKRNAEAAAELQKYLDLVPKAPDAEKLKSTIAELKKSS